MFLRGDEDGSNNKMMGARGNKARVRVRPEEVAEAANLAVSGQPFDVLYYPRASTPEFCVKAAAVRAAMRTQWCPGMRFKMAFETEDSSRISWFMGTVSAVQVADPIRWPNSPWRLLQVLPHTSPLLHHVMCIQYCTNPLKDKITFLSLIALDFHNTEFLPGMASSCR